MENFSQTVQTAFDQLVSEGFPLLSTNREEEEKARLTRRAAWLIHQIDRNIGLLQKTSGNNVLGLSVDIIIDKTNGDFADVASSEEIGAGNRRIMPVWVPKNDTNLISRWVQPTPELADITPGSSPQPPDPGTIPTPLPEESQVLARLDLMDKKLDRMVSLMEEMVDVATNFVNKFS